MKEWFKYEFGYVNIDAENLYLTNTGNWSETRDLAEKTKQVTNKNDNKSSSIIGFIMIVVCLLGFLLYKSLITGKLGIALIFITIGGGFKVYQYLKTEIGSRFKIPIEKITEIKSYKKNVEIYFINGEENSDSYKLIGIDEKGIKIMNSLKDSMYNSSKM